MTVRLPDCLVTLSPLLPILDFFLVFFHIFWIAFPVCTESATSVQAVLLQVQATKEIVTVDVMMPVFEKIQVSSCIHLHTHLPMMQMRSEVFYNILTQA